MKRVIFSGHSDDLVHVVQAPFIEPYSMTEEEARKLVKTEEYNVDERHNYAAKFLVSGKEGSAYVHAIYDGCWTFAFGLVDEGDQLPLFASRPDYGLDPDTNDYSLNLHFTVPDDTKVVKLS